MNAGAKSRNGSHVIVLLKHVDRTQMSAPDIVRRILRLCSEFSVTIITGTPNECRLLFPDARVVGIREAPSRNRELPFFIVSWLVLPFLRCDSIYVADVISLPGILTLTRGPSLCYGNTHPVQHVQARREKGSVLARLTAGIYGRTLASTMKKCDLIAAISPQLAAVFRSMGVAPQKIKTIEVGVPFETFSKPASRALARGSGPKIGVYTGTVSLERGLSVIVEGTREVAASRRDFRIRLIGCREADMSLVIKLIKDAGVTDIIEPAAPVPNSEIPGILWSSDWGISLLEPNKYFEASPPLKVLEYLAAGLPVIANKIATHSLYLDDGVNSILIDYSSDDFARATLRLIEDDGIRMRLAENALKGTARMSEKESLDRLVDEIRSLSGS